MDKEDGVNIHSGILCCAVPSSFSHVWLFATLWTVGHQALLSMGFSRQEYRSGLSCPSPGDLPDWGIESMSLMSPASAGDIGRFFTPSTSHLGSPVEYYSAIKKEWNNAICSNMDGPRYCDPKWSKLAKYHDTTYMWTLKYDTNELTKQTYRHSKQTYGYQREKMGGG